MSAVDIEDMTAKQDEIERKYRESQLQMEINLAIDKVNRVKNLLRYFVWVRYLKGLLTSACPRFTYLSRSRQTDPSLCS